MVSEEKLSDLTIKLTKSSRCILKLFFLLSAPSFLFLFALLGFFKVVNFNVEIHSIIMLGAIFFIYLMMMQHNAYYASCKLRANFILIKKELLEYINKNLLAIGSVEKANASLDDFLEAVSKNLRNENFSSIAAGFFPTLGILGTFISIALSMPDFSSQTSGMLEEEISKLLGGVGTAFYVSIYGIFLSLWWIFLEKSGTSRFQKDANIIKEETKNYFWQKEEIEQTYFRKSMENFEKLNTVFDTLTSNQFLDTLNETLVSRMNIFDQIIKHEQDSSTKVAEILSRSTNDLEMILEKQSNLSTTLHTLIIKFENFTKNLDTQNANFIQANNSLAVEFSYATTIAANLSENSAKLSDALNKLDVKNIEDLYSSVLKNIDTMKGDVDLLGNQFEKKIEDFDKNFIEKLKNTLKVIDVETAEIISKIEHLKLGEQ